MTIIQAFFTNSGVPAPGLSPVPTIRIRRLSDAVLVVTDALMTDIGDGLYTFDTESVSPIVDLSVDYGVLADGAAVISNVDQFKSGVLSSSDLRPFIDVS